MSAYLEDAMAFCIEQVEKGAEIGAEELHAGEESVTKLKDGTPQTPTDLKIDALLEKAVANGRPSDETYLGEESVKEGRVWIADPWDGSWLRASGARMGVVSMALVINGKSVLGAVRNPFTRETFYAVEGGPAYLNGGVISVNDVADLQGATFTLPGSNVPSLHVGGLFNELIVEGGGDMLTSGSAIYDLLQTVMGVTTASVYAYSSSWDGAAAHIIGRRAGAEISGLHGGPLWYGGDIDGLVITNGLVHSAMLAAVGRHLKPLR